MTVKVVIVDVNKRIDPVLLHDAAVAINQQIQTDVPQYWPNVDASVSWTQSLSALKSSDWPVFLVKKLPPDEGGFHLEKNNQPFAKVIALPDDASWTIDASHEIVEMLVDPAGNRTHPSVPIAIQGGGVSDAPGRNFRYLVEACDPCEANEFGYEIGGILVSDFITPHYYDSEPTPNTMYSFKGHITRPRELLKGGYISFINSDGRWQQILWVDAGPPVVKTLKMTGVHRSMREAVHTAMGKPMTRAKHEQRRKKGGVPPEVQARLSAYAARQSSIAEREQALRERYKL